MDKTSLTLGWLVGRRIAGQRSRKEPIAYLYNGVQLPPLPEWDREMYPYAYVCFMDHILDRLTGHYIWVTDRPIYANDETWSAEGTTRIICVHGEDAVGYMCYKLVDGIWTYERSSTISGTDMMYQIIWSNVDVYIMGHDSEDAGIYEPTNNLYIPASDPVPVYE